MLEVRINKKKKMGDMGALLTNKAGEPTLETLGLTAHRLQRH
jgi:hypothetical protein